MCRRLLVVLLASCAVPAPSFTAAPLAVNLQTAPLARGGALPLMQQSGRKRRPSKKRDPDAKPRAPTPAKAYKFMDLCYGCGAELQTDEPAAAGYVELERYELKAKHKQLHQVLCCRCRSLSQGEILPAVVEGRLREAGAEGFATPEELRNELLHLRDRKVLTVLLVDVTDVTGSFLPKVRDLIAGNPVVLIGTKADLLPAKSNVEEVKGWMAEVLGSRLNVLSVHLVSARTGEGLPACRYVRYVRYVRHTFGCVHLVSTPAGEAMAAAAKDIMTSRSGRDVYVMGAANVGKSMFIGGMLEQVGYSGYSGYVGYDSYIGCSGDGGCSGYSGYSGCSGHIGYIVCSKLHRLQW